VVLAGLFSALRVTGGRLEDQRLLFMGAGEAATGIADLVVAALVAGGVGEVEARSRCWLFDSQGLVTAGRAEIAEHKRPYAHAHAHAPVQDFAAAVTALQPTGIIGVAAVGGTFTPEVLREMARLNDRPIVFALSNPTSKSECTAEQAYAHTEGRALYASGSPFPAVARAGRTFVPRQGNNSYIFPGVGLGVTTCRARHVVNDMFLAAARALADTVTSEDLAQGSLYPPLTSIRDASLAIAVAVAEVAYARGLAATERPVDLAASIRGTMYEPHYADLV
jgi:malate dehydrogenase (oxaloacetate-decarboxylating)(NADP+)